jgi:acetoin utilization deacetylase AcuC-like enzyme
MSRLIGMLAACVCVLPVLAYTDEPAAVADWQTLLRRIETLERRVDALESAALQTKAESPAPADKRPVLEVHSETWCGPCQQFKADLQAAGEVPVEVRWVRFSDRVPAFRWTGPDGRQVVRTGYQRGTLQALLAEVVAPKAAKE